MSAMENIPAEHRGQPEGPCPTPSGRTSQKREGLLSSGQATHIDCELAAHLSIDTGQPLGIANGPSSVVATATPPNSATRQDRQCQERESRSVSWLSGEQQGGRAR